MKKILLFILLFFTSLLTVFWEYVDPLKTLTNEQMEILDKWWTLTAIDSNWDVVTLSNPISDYEKSIPGGTFWLWAEWVTWVNTTSSDSNWNWWAWDLTSSDFEINVSDISPWIVWKWANTSERVNWLLGTIIQTMMIALWVLSVLIMTIWAWYMILHNWQDELLSKWKSIFMSWVYAMIIALTSYYLIAIVRFLLYNN